jgi:hypothetical protein
MAGARPSSKSPIIWKETLNPPATLTGVCYNPEANGKEMKYGLSYTSISPFFCDSRSDLGKIVSPLGG